MSKAPGKYLLHILAIISGAIAIFAFAPYNFIPAFIISIVCLIFIIDNSPSGKRASLMGFLWGVGFFIGGLHWFAFALMVDWQRLFWLMPFSATILQAILALYIALFGFLCSIKFKNNFVRIYFLTCAWVAIEWLRGNLLTGFPWIISGYVFSKIDGISQLASITGIYGLSFIIICLSLAIYLLIKLKNLQSLINLIITLALTLTIQLYGVNKIAKQEIKNIPMPKVLVVQSGRLAHKPTRQEGINTFYTHLEMTKENYQNEDLIIWSESSHPFLIDKEHNNFGTLFDFLNPSSKVIIGSPTVTTDSAHKLTYWNSLLLVGKDGRIEKHYDKMHLVPFGEYIPFHKYLPPIEIITENLTSYSAQNKMRNITVDKYSFRPLICYEAIFSDHPIDAAVNADYIVNITNDNWYGDSLGPYQHFSMTKYRAIEQGVPLVRVAISGISAIFDSYGRVMNQINLSQKGLISAILPEPLASAPLYCAQLEYFLIFSLALLAFIFFILRNKNF